MTELELNQQQGFLAWQPLEGVQMDYAYTELVRHAEEGDVTALAKLKTIAKYVGNNPEAVKKYAQDQLPRLEKVVFPVKEEAKATDKKPAAAESHTEEHHEESGSPASGEEHH